MCNVELNWLCSTHNNKALKVDQTVHRVSAVTF